MPIPTVLEIAHLPCADLPPVIAVPPLARPFNVTITPPGSKSLTNRALLLAALAEGESILTNALVDADDTRVMIAALRQLGATITADPGSPTTLRIRGVAGRWRVSTAGVTLDLENAGTAVRFLTGAAILAEPGSGPITIDGNERMRERPIGELVDLLRELGATVEYLGRTGSPPVRIRPPRTLDDLSPTLHIGRTESSQFISALLLIAAFLPRGLHLFLKRPVTSEPYLNLSSSVLCKAGARAYWALGDDEIAIRIPSLGERFAPPTPPSSPAYYAPRPFTTLPQFQYDVEPDASSAAYFWAATALIADASLTIPARWRRWWDSPQPDTVIAHLLVGRSLRCPDIRNPPDDLRFEGVGRIDPISAAQLSLARAPDLTMTLAVLACFASPTAENPTATSTLRGLRTLRHKESDRIAALEAELTKLGADVEILTAEDDESLRITPPPDLASSPASLGHTSGDVAPLLTFDTYNDHRLAMSLALVGLRRPNVFIRNPACVSKTYPAFWRDLARLYTA